jgi:hypothetical protein
MYIFNLEKSFVERDPDISALLAFFSEDLDAVLIVFG